MKNLIKKYIPTLFTISFLTIPLEGIQNEEIKKIGMLSDIDMIKHTFEVTYAPAAWKKTYAQWDLNTAVTKVKDQIASTKNINGKKFQQILKHFLSSARDYHVQILFSSTESAFLPFTVKGIDGKYFISWIDDRVLSPNNFCISIGDELIEFNGLTTDKAIAQIRADLGTEINAQTDQSLAELALTSRKGMRGDVVPRGPVNVKVKSKNGSLHSYQLIWDYTPELVKNAIDLPVASDCALSTFARGIAKPTIKRQTMLYNSLGELFEHPTLTRPGLGSFESFVPTLGEKILDAENASFKAYIYQHPNGAKIGYIRIPEYKSGVLEKVETFGQLMNLFELETDALVIDQVNNPGGLLLYQYALLSTLTDKPLSTPKHRSTINQEDILRCYQELALLNQIDSDKDAAEIFSDNAFFNTYEYVVFLKESNHFMINEWNKGRTLTNPTYLDGVDHINPHPKYRYTKPILMLINELDFSGGDFFPAILQDNKRATLFGTRTAGAGGCVRRFHFPNLNGINFFTYTWTIAERDNLQPIENLGVTPDLEYQITEEDLVNDYIEYKNAVNKAVEMLIPKKKV